MDRARIANIAMNTHSKTFAAALAVALAAGASWPAQADHRVSRLGTARLAAHERDVDLVAVPCRPRVAAIKLRSANRAAEIEHVLVTYGNGERDRLPVRRYLDRGQETRWIDLGGRRRCVTEIAVVGDSEGRQAGFHDRGDRRRRPARVEIYGRF
jgi:hypothetical protein